MHPLTAKFAKFFRRLPPEERERVAEQLLGFLGTFKDKNESTWGRLLWVDGEVEALNEVSGATLAELMTEAGIEPGTSRRSS